LRLFHTVSEEVFSEVPLAITESLVHDQAAFSAMDRCS
jgi:hypothetical protein